MTTAMDLVPTSRIARITARIVVGLVGVLVLALVLTPWQQSAPGRGRIVAYAPEERRQNLEAPVEGRVLRWHVREGSVVAKGDAVVELADNDPDILLRLRQEREALAMRMEATRARVDAIGGRLSALDGSRGSAVVAADARVRMAAERVSASDHARTAARATLETAASNARRQEALTQQGLASVRQRELALLEENKARTDLARAEVGLSAAQSELVALGADREKLASDGSASLADGRASRSAAEADVASARAELARMDVRLARQSSQSVTAPRAGTIFRVVANGNAGEVVKAGDLLAVLVPSTTDRAVELYVSGNDMPLVHAGQTVRVQFEGWPAVQFSGWPSVAVGTFAGRIASVDTADNGAGAFRVLVVPADGATWPAPVYLRQGVRVQGFVQLGRVKLGYELWRQLNGFPASLPREPDMVKDDAPSSKGGGK